MAAGVSIRAFSLLQILGLCVILAGTKSLQDAVDDTSYTIVADAGDAPLHNDPVQLERIAGHRSRRQAPAAGDSGADSADPADDPASSSAGSAGSAGSGDVTTEASSQTPMTTEAYNISVDNHNYYTSSVQGWGEDENRWLDLSTMGKQTHLSLSDSHRTAATVNLKFTFPFYGHNVKKVTIATGGFLYMSDFLHQWLTATQYIAPLMANFDSRLGNLSNIHYADNATAFAVMWENLILQDHQQAGPFSFQAILHKDGSIIFNYKDVPLVLASITTKGHPVKVGLSDAFYMDSEIMSNIKRRTIYEYHRVEIAFAKVTNRTTVRIEPLPTCLSFGSCGGCETAALQFSCKWCPRLGRCSDGLDRKRQEWMDNGCHKAEISASECPTAAPPRIVTDASGNPVTDDAGNVLTHPPDSMPYVGDNGGNFVAGIGVAGVIAILIVIFLIVLITGWFVYAYMNPQSKAGIWLIEHRPSNLRAKLSQVKFWKRRGDTGADKYEVSMDGSAGGGESVA